MQVPLIDLKAQYAQIKPDIDQVIQEVLSAGSFIGGQAVSDFENSFAKKSNALHCISVANGTDALYISLKALGIKEGDEVITTASSWVSTASMIQHVGAIPVFVDIDPDTYTIDPSLIEEKITERTKVIIPVHLYGQMADMTKIKSICNKYNLYCIEDTAQAHFARLGDTMPGEVSDIATFSFYPTKNLGAYGDGGCITTSDDELAQRSRAYANYGNKGKDNILGINSRLDTLQAAILNVKLNHVDTWIDQRISHADTYDRLLKNVSQITIPTVKQQARHTYYAYAIRCQDRDQLQKHLSEKGVTTTIHYPTILPLLPIFTSLDHREDDFSVAYLHQQETLSLPIYAELTDEQITYVADCIRDFYN